MDKYISSYSRKRTIFLADTDSYTIIKNGFNVENLMLKIKSASLLYDHVFIPAAFMWQSKTMAEVMHKANSFILTEKVLPIVRKNEETRDIKDYFEKRQFETSKIKELESYCDPALASEIVTKENERDMEYLNALNMCLHLEETSVKDEFIKLWVEDLNNSVDLCSISMILYQANIEEKIYFKIIKNLNDDVNYETFSRGVLVDYIAKMNISDSVKEKLKERISWLYLNANAEASESDFYITNGITSKSVYRANLKVYMSLLAIFGLDEKLIEMLSCEDILRIKSSPEYINFVENYIEIVDNIYIQQEDILIKVKNRIDKIISKEEKMYYLKKCLHIMTNISATIFLSLIANYFSDSNINTQLFYVSGGAAVLPNILKKFDFIDKVMRQSSFYDFKKYIISEEYKKQLNLTINGVII